jgi:hypothetical protein
MSVVLEKAKTQTTIQPETSPLAAPGAKIKVADILP